MNKFLCYCNPPQSPCYSLSKTHHDGTQSSVSPVPRTQVVLSHPWGSQLLVPVSSWVFGTVLRLRGSSFHVETGSFEVDICRLLRVPGLDSRDTGGSPRRTGFGLTSRGLGGQGLVLLILVLVQTVKPLLLDPTCLTPSRYPRSVRRPSTSSTTGAIPFVGDPGDFLPPHLSCIAVGAGVRLTPKLESLLPLRSPDCAERTS